jgi:hypothetical protein
MGHVGLTAPPAKTSTAVSVLRTVTALLFCLIVVMALGIVIARQHTIDTLREQLDGIAADRAREQAVEDCRGLFLDDVVVSGAALDAQLAHLVAVVYDTPSDNPDRANVITVEIAQLDKVNERSQAAAAAYDAYTADPDPPGKCSHPTSQGD